MSQADILNLAESGRAEDLQMELWRRNLCSLYYFGKVTMGYNKMVDHLHLPLCDHLQNTITVKKRGVLWPRGHFKSTVIAKAYPLWRVLPIPLSFEKWMHERGEDAMLDLLHKWHNPDNRFLIIGETDGVAQKDLKDARWHLENNQVLRWLFYPNFKPEGKWTDSELLLPRSKSWDESTLVADGVGAKGTGFHYTGIIYDDPIGEKAAKSVRMGSGSEMRAAIDWFKTAPGLLEDPKTGEELIAATRWCHGTLDLYGWIMAHLPDPSSEAVQSLPKEDADAVNERDGFTWSIKSCFDDEGKPIFPERFTIASLKAIRHREGAYLFNCQYMNDPTAPEGSDFTDEMLNDYTISEDKRTLIPSDGTPPVTVASLYRITFWDPSPGGQQAEAENALITIGASSDRRIFVLDPWMKNCTYGQALEHYHRVNDMLRPIYTYYEQVGAQKSVEDVEKERQLAGKESPYCKHCASEGRGDKIVHRPLHLKAEKPPAGTKEDRILGWSREKISTRQVYFRFGGMFERLRKQITQFPHSKPIDGFDALAYCLHLVKYPSRQEDEATEKADSLALQQAWKPRTNTQYDYGGY